jgi:hypothetical protein
VRSVAFQDVFSEEKGRVEGCLRHIEKEENATPVALVGGHGSGEIYEKQIELRGIKTVKLEICGGYDSFMSTVRADTGFIHGRKGIMAPGACI